MDTGIVLGHGNWTTTISAVYPGIGGSIIAERKFVDATAALGYLFSQMAALNDRPYPVTFSIDGPAFICQPVTIHPSYEAVMLDQVEREALMYAEEEDDYFFIDNGRQAEPDHDYLIDLADFVAGKY